MLTSVVPDQYLFNLMAPTDLTVETRLKFHRLNDYGEQDDRVH